MKTIYLTSILIFIFSGCVIKQNNSDSYKLKYMHSTSITDFNELSQTLLLDICPTLLNIKDNKKNILPLYVTDFVNLSNLQNNSDLGFILSDELKTSISQKCNWPIYAIEFTKYLKLGTTGAKLLSRNTKDIKYTKVNQNTYALVGTYSITQRQLVLYLKLINLNNGVILKSSSKRVELTDEIIELENKKKNIQRQIYQPIVL